VAVHHHRSADAAAEVVEAILAAGGRAMALAADLADEARARGLIEAAAALGPVTCLVNNASVFEGDTVATATQASWERHLAVNLRAPFVLSQAFAAALPERRSGVIVNLLDQRVFNLTPHFVSYTVSKAGLWTLTRTLALALAPRIRVNGIGPGPTMPSRRQDEVAFAAQVAATPLGRAVSLEEICAAVRFILDAPSLTGQMIALDSGQHLGWQHPSQPETARE
jgi:NAD(P)-dependent dehydrogenase (short-subunit alcohol dehydrogenase family)